MMKFGRDQLLVVLRKLHQQTIDRKDCAITAVELLV